MKISVENLERIQCSKIQNGFHSFVIKINIYGVQRFYYLNFGKSGNKSTNRPGFVSSVPAMDKDRFGDRSLLVV